MYQTLRYEKQENIGILTINRPEALNALNSTVIGDLEQAIAEVEKDAELGALLIAGEGRMGGVLAGLAAAKLNIDVSGVLNLGGFASLISIIDLVLMLASLVKV